MLETIFLVIGFPVFYVGLAICCLCGAVVWEAVGAYCHSNRIRKLMARRWPDEQ
jgi:hypothetical protein